MMEKASSKKNYLEVSYNEKKLPKTDYPQKLAHFLTETFFLKKGTLLDVGCGRGEFLEAFKNEGMKVHGLDISPKVHEFSKNFQVAQCDFEKEAFVCKDNTYDFIFSKSVVEHLHYPERLMDECYRVLKKGGKAVFMCPSWIHTYWGPFYIDHTHVTPFTLPSLEQLLELSGFKIVWGEHFLQLPIVWKIPLFKILSDITSVLPIPFRPLYKTSLPEPINKWVRFSKEKMLLVVGEKR